MGTEPGGCGNGQGQTSRQRQTVPAVPPASGQTMVSAKGRRQVRGKPGSGLHGQIPRVSHAQTGNQEVGEEDHLASESLVSRSRDFWPRIGTINGGARLRRALTSVLGGSGLGGGAPHPGSCGCTPTRSPDKTKRPFRAS